MLDQLPARLRVKIEVIPSGCWEWSGYINHAGYGLAAVGSLPSTAPGKLTPTHRLVYETLVGPIPAGAQLDHECHDPEVCAPGPECPHRRCVNPAHLSAVTNRENSLRSGSPSALNAVKTHCPLGHEYDEANTYVNPKGERNCRQCARDRRAARTPEQVEIDLVKGRERAARNRARDPEKQRERCRQWRRDQSAAS